MTTARRTTHWLWTAGILLVSAATTAPAAAATYYVRAGGDDHANGRTPKTAFRTVLRAARLINHGDRIVIGPGTYKDPVLIAERFGTKDAPLAIVGDESGVLTGDRPGTVVLRSDEPGECALRFHRTQNLLISGLTIRGVGEGLRVEKARGARIERCTFEGLAKAVSLSDSEDVFVESTVIARGLMGVVLKNAARTRLAHLTVVSCSAAGIMISSSPGGSVRNCLLADNSTGMTADNASAPSWSSDYNTVQGTLGSWGLVPLCRIAYEWFAASGQERHSNFVLPAFVDPEGYDLHVDANVSWGGGLPGACVGIGLTPPVALDRDGKPFTVREGRVPTGAYDYPPPRGASGWKKLDVALSAEGVRHSAALYAKDGNLVRTLLADAAGVRELWWDGRDDTGQALEPGAYDVRHAAHDVQVLDDGAVGDNGNPLGTYNCDNAHRIVVYPDGSFVISTFYDEAGVPLRFHSSSGQPVSGSALARPNIWGLAAEGRGKNLIAGVDRELHRIVAPGERAKMPSGADAYPILGDGETLAKAASGKKDAPFGGVAVAGARIFVSVPLASGAVVRAFDLATGKKLADWPLHAAGDIDPDAQGNLWVLCGEEVLCLNPKGQVIRRLKAGVHGSYLAVGKTHVAVVSTATNRITLLRLSDGQLVRTFGREHPANTWLPPHGDLFRDLRDAAFLPDGQLLICQHGSIRALDLETAAETMSVASNFMDALVPHPKDPSVFYCYRADVMGLDHKTGAWSFLRLAPPRVADDLALGMCITSGTVDGRQYLLVHGKDTYVPSEEEKKEKKPASWPRRFVLLDVTDPLAPRYAGCVRSVHPLVYTDIRFDKDGNLCWPEASGRLKIAVNKFLGRDARGMLRYTHLGPSYRTETPLEYRGIAEKDPTPRGMFHKGGLTIDLGNNDNYLLACTPLQNKMVPAWGASGTGVGKLAADGRPLWFVPSSGGNYTSISSVLGGSELWIMAAKDFGGQIDLFTADGLRLTTGNVGWGCHWTSGFVDMREGVQAYLRPDGKPGAHVEDDAIGRFCRMRVDGAETLRRTVAAVRWPGGDATPAAAPPSPHETAGRPLRNMLRIARVKDLPLGGDWAAWAAAGVTPQILSLPVVAWSHACPPDLLQTFNAGTSIGALAHDGRNLYVCFLTTDDTPHFHAPGDGRNMFEFDSIELWLEEEQFGLGLNDQGQPRLFKYRHHNREGKEWAANFPMPDNLVWGAKLGSVADHALGRLLGSALGASLEGKPGYTLMAKIPFEEIKLVGGIAGRKGGDVLPMKGAPGEILRVGVSFDGMSAWGRSQDFKVYWPTGLMFSDPTSFVPAVLEEAHGAP